jgi:hypothetical protein
VPGKLREIDVTPGGLSPFGAIGERLTVARNAGLVSGVLDLIGAAPVLKIGSQTIEP